MRRLVLIILGISLASGTATGVGSGLFIKSSIDAGNASQRQRLHIAQVNGCSRQNVKQAASNKNALATWKFDTFFAAAITVPQPHATAKERRLTRDFRAHLEETAATLTWTPLNHDCAGAPTAVQLPVPFSRGKPGRADLTITIR